MPILKAEGKTFPTRTQVLIVGAGACGTIAALAAKEHGAEVLILERDAKPTGSTSLSGGQIPAAGTKLQRAAGLLDDTPEILAKDIIDKALIAKYIPEMVNTHYHGHVGNTGDAVKWGEALGASIKDMGSFQGHGAVATPHNTHIGWPAITEGGYQVNKHGKRFSNENQGYSEQALKVARQPDHIAWLIFDERGHQVSMQMHSHVVAEEAGALKRCNTPEDIAKVIGCDAATLAQTM